MCHGAVAPRVGEFVRAHFTLFDLPPPVAEEVLRRQPKGLRAFAAAELRAYLKRKLTERPKRDALLATRAWAPLHSPSFCLELLSECARDLPSHGGRASHRELVGLHLLLTLSLTRPLTLALALTLTLTLPLPLPLTPTLTRSGCTYSRSARAASRP